MAPPAAYVSADRRSHRQEGEALLQTHPDDRTAPKTDLEDCPVVKADLEDCPASPTVLDDLFDSEVVADPYDYFGRLRAVEPVHWNQRFGLWVVTGYKEVVWLLRHPEFFSSQVIQSTTQPPYPPIDAEDRPLFEEVRTFRSDQLVEKDRPDHLRMRSVVHPYFTPTAMEEWRPFVRQAVAELLDELEPAGHMDVLTDFAAPLPVRIIARMMDVSYDDRDYLRELADSILHMNRGEPDRLRPLVQGIRGIVEYAAPLVEARIQEPGNDFISILAQGEKEGIFTRHQVLVNTGLLLFAGHETTMNLIGNGLLALIRHPDQWDRLRANPDGLARTATEECLRYDPPVKSTQRVATQEVELGGRTLHEGDRIRWIMAAANRDPSVFPEPDRFDIGRQPNPHLSFGSGIHYCLGVALARMEGQEVFRALAERFPRFELAPGREELATDRDELATDRDEPATSRAEPVTYPVEYQPSLQFRSLKSLPVTWNQEEP